ncbi:hypothetical protein B0H10DRAFT_1937649 [Mycena sp. CBHHK59/15]|nr:hypothetical protein B0H10DRAFT_1937649 [Mycena sp. CBHHK59/15]
MYMVKADTTEKKRRRRERKLREEEERKVFVSSTDLMFPDASDWPDHICSFVCGTAICDGTFDQGPTINTIHMVPTVPHDFSALCSESAHPWQTICRRSHGLLSHHRERHPFLQSLPKKTAVPTPPAAIHAIVTEPAPIPSPIAFPLEPPPPQLPPSNLQLLHCWPI